MATSCALRNYAGNTCTPHIRVAFACATNPNLSFARHNVCSGSEPAYAIHLRVCWFSKQRPW